MNIYNKIIDNIVRTDDNWFEYNYKPSNNVSYILKVYFSMLKQGILYKSRILFFYDQINNKLINNYQSEFEYLFNKIQHHYYVLVRFVNMCKYKKAKILVNMDLQLNEIKETDKGVLSILHCEKKYLFKSYELIKHINMSLTNSPNFFATPMQIKNPYNGIPFNKSTLYNIYFYIKFNTCMQIELFHKYFMNNFNILMFEIEHEPIIREYAIKNYINNSTNEVLNGHLLNMLDDYNASCTIFKRIEIDREFPKQKLIKIMKPYLSLYIYSLYSMNVGKQKYYQYLLYKKLSLFNKHNNRFGKKIVRSEKINPEKIGDPVKIIFHHEFDEDHVKYSSISIDKFMKNHLNTPYMELNTHNNNLQNRQSQNRQSQNIENNNPLLMLSIVNNMNELERLLDNMTLTSQSRNIDNANIEVERDVENINEYNYDESDTLMQTNNMDYLDENIYDNDNGNSDNNDDSDDLDDSTDSVS